jgi:hypothetical protein
MRKYLYAGAVAGGLLLMGAAPAYADVLPAPVNAQPDGGGLGGVLGSDGGLGLDNPLGGSRILNIDPGTNTPDLTGPAGSVLPDTGSLPAARTGLGKATGGKSAAKPAAGPVEDLPGVGGGGLPTGGLPTGGLGGGGLPTGALGGLPVANLLQGGLLGGLLPDGRMRTMPTRESGLLSDNLSVLGALDGVLPVPSARTLPALSGLPAGGTDVPAADQPDTRQPQPAAPTDPAPQQPADDPAIANDGRLHEEPTEPEADGRRFSDGRPVAGVDSDYK